MLKDNKIDAIVLETKARIAGAIAGSPDTLPSAYDEGDSSVERGKNDAVAATP